MAAHQEIIATRSLDPMHAQLFVLEACCRSSRLMAEREDEIGAGMVHETFAMTKDKSDKWKALEAMQRGVD